MSTNTPHTSTDLMTAAVATPPIDRSLRLPIKQYLPERTPKSLVVLHFTAGASARSAFNTWIADAPRIGAAYIVDADAEATIYEVFDPACYAYALGIHDARATETERRAIQIEIANVGPLVRRGDDLCWWPGNFTRKWCAVRDTDRYVHVAPDVRGMGYYARFPEAQLHAVAGLVRFVCKKYGIPAVLPPAEKRAACDLDFYTRFCGVASHQNFRRDKYDIGPAWDWAAFETLLHA